MADIDDINQAEDETRLALLTAIGKKAETVTAVSQLRDLSLAFALTVGAKLGQIPGGFVDVAVSK